MNQLYHFPLRYYILLVRLCKVQAVHFPKQSVLTHYDQTMLVALLLVLIKSEYEKLSANYTLYQPCEVLIIEVKGSSAMYLSFACCLLHFSLV